MRTFIGIQFNDKTIVRIEKSLIPLKEISNPIKWVKPYNIHLTLKFIGEVAASKFQQIEHIFNKEPISQTAFDLRIEGLGKFGRKNDISIIWVGIRHNRNLQALFASIEAKLETIGISKESRDFRPHITVGRNHKPYNFKFVFDLLQNNLNLFIDEFIVNKFQIFKSDLTSQGPKYTILKEISLAES